MPLCQVYNPEIRRWKGTDNDLDDRATALVLKLLVQQVESFSPEDIAAAALALLSRAANSQDRGAS